MPFLLMQKKIQTCSEVARIISQNHWGVLICVFVSDIIGLEAWPETPSFSTTFYAGQKISPPGRAVKLWQLFGGDAAFAQWTRRTHRLSERKLFGGASLTVHAKVDRDHSMRCRRLAGRTRDLVVRQVNHEIVFGKMTALRGLGNFCDELGFTMLKLLAHRRGAISAVANRHFNGVAGVALRGLDQDGGRLAVVHIARHHLDRGDQLRLGVSGHRGFVTVKPLLCTLAAVAHLDIGGGHDAIFGNSLVDGDLPVGGGLEVLQQQRRQRGRGLASASSVPRATAQRTSKVARCTASSSLMRLNACSTQALANTLGGTLVRPLFRQYKEA